MANKANSLERQKAPLRSLFYRRDLRCYRLMQGCKMNQSLNYDNTNIHKIYDTSRSLPSETIDLWLNTIDSAIDNPIENIIDLGCGTGRFTLPL